MLLRRICLAGGNPGESPPAMTMLLRATVMLYRAAKDSGTVDRRMLEDAVKLAAS